MMGNLRGIAAVAALAVVGSALFTMLPVEQRLGNRLSDNAAVDQQRHPRLALRPVPRAGPGVADLRVRRTGEGREPAGRTRRHPGAGVAAAGLARPRGDACFVGFFVVSFGRTWRRTDPAGLVCSTVLLVGTIELVYYGVVPNGLPIMMRRRRASPSAGRTADDPEPGEASGQEEKQHGGPGMTPGTDPLRGADPPRGLQRRAPRPAAAPPAVVVPAPAGLGDLRHPRRGGPARRRGGRHLVLPPDHPQHPEPAAQHPPGAQRDAPLPSDGRRLDRGGRRGAVLRPRPAHRRPHGLHRGVRPHGDADPDRAPGAAVHRADARAVARAGGALRRRDQVGPLL